MSNGGVANNWKDYQWESWIPVEIQKQIEDFWSPRIGRGPHEWKQDELEQGAPKTGEIVTLKKIGRNEYVTGRYVHAWNWIGRIVHEDGSFDYVSFR